jgi:hypothetical protein
VALDKVDPFLLVEMKLSALILATSDVLSCAVIKLQKPSNNYVTRCCSAPFETRSSQSTPLIGVSRIF